MTRGFSVYYCGVQRAFFTYIKLPSCHSRGEFRE